MKILLIDDQESEFITLKMLLSGNDDLDLRFEWASNFNAGVQIIDLWTPDATLLDLNLGSDFLADRTIPEIPTIRHRTAVLGLTGIEDTGNGLWARCIEAGAMNFLQKSHYFNPDKLTRKSLMHAIFNSAKLWKEMNRVAKNT